MQCPTCGNETVKFGKDRHGLQRFKCATCAKTFTEPHAMAGKHTSMADTVNVLKMLLEGMSIRSCERMTGIHRDTILGLVVEAGESCQRFMEANIVKVPAEVVECDEQWAFVFMKRKTAERKGINSDDVGDRYVFTAIDRDSKLLLCWHAGQRSQNDTWTFTDKLFKAVSGRPELQPEKRKCQTVAFRVEPDDREAIQKAADIADMKLSDWIRDRLLIAAHKEATNKQSAAGKR